MDCFDWQSFIQIIFGFVKLTKIDDSNWIEFRSNEYNKLVEEIKNPFRLLKICRAEFNEISVNAELLDEASWIVRKLEFNKNPTVILTGRVTASSRRVNEPEKNELKLYGEPMERIFGWIFPLNPSIFCNSVSNRVANAAPEVGGNSFWSIDWSENRITEAEYEIL